VSSSLKGERIRFRFRRAAGTVADF
jgi:hypothetical protein